MTPLGSPVEPEVKRIFAIVPGPTSACAAATAPDGAVCINAAKAVASRPAGGSAVTTTSALAGTAAAMARANAVPFAAKTSPGDSNCMMALSLPKSADNSE